MHALTLAALIAVVTPEDARHLLARTGLGPTRAEVEALVPLTREAAVDRVLASVRTTPVTAPPSFAARPLSESVPPRRASEDERQAYRRARIAEAIELKSWWANELLVTTSPFTEHLVLFWSNHFTSSLQKVKVPALLWRQHLTIRAHAGGDFRALLHAVVDDPAMLVYLDGNKNEAGAPNENFARELLELFTLGAPPDAGLYSERDVKEAARAFAGTRIRLRGERAGELVSRRRLQDDGSKTFLGVTGELDGDDIVEILLQQPRTAELVVEKLWLDLVSPTPDARVVRALAARFREDWRIDRLLRALLLTDAFWAPESRGALVKSPVELVVGAARSLALVEVEAGRAVGDPSPEWVAFTVRALGQDLFDPPNVKGWPTGERMVTTLTLPDRERLARQAAAASALVDVRPNGTAVPLATLLLPLPTTSTSLDDIARDPAFQLK